MAKDPAMLWYWGDWNSGTSLFSRFLKGCYMDVLHAQFNNGRLSLEEIKTCLGSDFGTAWPTLQKKFKQDKTGLFFNERLELEKEKRKAFTESRRKNLEGSPHMDTHMKPHMVTHMENEDVNKNINEINKKEPKIDFSKPDIDGDEIVFPIDTTSVRAIWATWKEYRFREHGDKYGIMGEQAALKLLSTLGEDQFKATILKAIESKWKNLYPEKNGKPAKQTTTDLVTDYARRYGVDGKGHS